MKTLIFFIVLIILLFCSCSSETKNEILSELPKSSSGTAEVSEPEEEPKAEIDYDFYASHYEDTKDNEYELPSGYDDELCFTFKVPDLTGKEMSELPFIFENPEWCINGTDWIQLDEEHFSQYLFEENKEAAALAKAVALLTPHHGLFSHAYGSKTFDSITEANEKELLWAAICQTPQRRPSENENHAFNFVSNYFSELTEYSWVACEIYSEADVEKTFRWLFGKDANFVPQNIEMFGIRYFDELDVFVQFFDGILMMPRFPQIVSYSEKSGVYTVETVLSGAYPNGEIGFELKLTDGTYEFFPANKETVALVSEMFKSSVYTFEKAEDGHFVLTGFSY